MPPYIGLCIRAVQAHNADVRILDRAAFDELFTTHRELDVDALAVNHRSDFVRSYLLAHYGGLYVDADCVALRSFDSLFDAVEDIGFVGYRQPDGYMSTNLMASRAGGVIISDHYRQVAEKVASGRSMAWLDLASVPMDAAVARHPADAQLLPSEIIMPLWWGHSDALSTRRSDAEHKAHFAENVLCYMLSNNTIGSGAFSRALTYAPEEALMHDRSFLSYLFRRALGGQSPEWHDVPGHLGGHEDVTQLDEGALDYMVQRFGVRTMVDIGCGPGGMLYYARLRGVNAVGVDGDPTVARGLAEVVEHDYTKGPLSLGDFDLGWVVEFVEHVEDRYLGNHLETLRGCKVVFMTAATPGQPGYHHVNCRPREYWVTRLAEIGFDLDQEATEGVHRASTMGSGFTRHSGMVYVRRAQTT